MKNVMPSVIISAILASGVCCAQSPRQFDVASIKPNRSEDRGGGMRTASGTVSARNLSVNMLIQTAYKVKSWQISGGPGWAATDRYDIDAKTTGNPSFQEKMEMFQPLLVDRFQLKVHHETRQMPTYLLMPGRNGPKLQATPSEVGGYVRDRRGLIEGRAVNLRTLADILSGTLGQQVTDKTGLTGGFDVKLEWTPTEAESNFRNDDRPFDPNGSSLFTAIQEQLGLKLEAGKGPVEMLIIDRVERPSEN